MTFFSDHYEEEEHRVEQVRVRDVLKQLGLALKELARIVWVVIVVNLLAAFRWATRDHTLLRTRSSTGTFGGGVYFHVTSLVFGLSVERRDPVFHHFAWVADVHFGPLSGSVAWSGLAGAPK